ncbi:MAG: TnpV protein [Acutalibacteraceae bacterium]
MWQYLSDIDSQAQQIFDILVKQMKEHEDITEKLKDVNQLLWMQRMNNIRNRANEVVCKELIF